MKEKIQEKANLFQIIGTVLLCLAAVMALFDLTWAYMYHENSFLGDTSIFERITFATGVLCLGLYGYGTGRISGKILATIGIIAMVALCAIFATGCGAVSTLEDVYKANPSEVEANIVSSTISGYAEMQNGVHMDYEGLTVSENQATLLYKTDASKTLVADAMEAQELQDCMAGIEEVLSLDVAPGSDITVKVVVEDGNGNEIWSQITNSIN